MNHSVENEFRKWPKWTIEGFSSVWEVFENLATMFEFRNTICTLTVSVIAASLLDKISNWRVEGAIVLSIESLQPFLRSAKSSFVKLTSGDQKAKLTIIFTYAATCKATKSMSTKSSSFSELDSSSSAKVSRIPGKGNV